MEQNRSAALCSRLLVCVFLYVLTAGMAGPPSHTQELPTTPLPDFSLPLLDGSTVRLSDFRDKNPVLLVFFATWCAPCNVEVPILNRIYEDYGPRGLKLFAINVEESHDWVARWVEKRGTMYPVLLDQRGSVARTYGVFSVPTNILIGFDGKVTFWHNVLPEKSHLESVLTKPQPAQAITL